jgi:site-specific recombinase XerD
MKLQVNKQLIQAHTDDPGYRELLLEFFENFDSQFTKKSYETDIQQFFEFYRQQRPVANINQLRRIHGVVYKKWLTEAEYAPKTINRKLAACSSFFDFLMEKDLVQQNPFYGIRRPKQEVKDPTNDLTDQDILELFSKLDELKGPSAHLHRAIMHLFFTTGMRKRELIELKREDLYQKNDRSFIKIRAKGGKILEKLLAEQTVEYLDDYLSWMSSIGREIHPKDWLFQPTKNPLNGNLVKPIQAKSIDYIFKQACRRAGITTKVSVHSARASYIGSAIEAGVDLYKIAQDVGHSSVKTTEEYNKRKRKISDSPVHHLGFLKK